MHIYINNNNYKASILNKFMSLFYFFRDFKTCVCMTLIRINWRTTDDTIHYAFSMTNKINWVVFSTRFDGTASLFNRVIAIIVKLNDTIGYDVHIGQYTTTSECQEFFLSADNLSFTVDNFPWTCVHIDETSLSARWRWWKSSLDMSS